MLDLNALTPELRQKVMAEMKAIEDKRTAENKARETELALIQKTLDGLNLKTLKTFKVIDGKVSIALTRGNGNHQATWETCQAVKDGKTLTFRRGEIAEFIRQNYGKDCKSWTENGSPISGVVALKQLGYAVTCQ